MGLEIFIDNIGFSVCHQLSERSLRLGNIVIPVCARCHGLYMGFLVAAIVLFLMYRKREAGLPPRGVIIVLVLFIVSTLADGLLSYLGIIETNNNVRLITGFLCMASIAAILYPVFVFQYFNKSSQKKILSRPKHLIIFLTVLAAVIALNLARLEFLGPILYYLTAFSIVFTFYFINLAVVLLFPFFAQKSSRLFSKYLLIPSIIAIILAALELYVFYLVRLAAERAVL